MSNAILLEISDYMFVARGPSACYMKIPSSWMLRRVFLVRTDISEKRIASIIKVARIGELGQY
jgi:hypothetical protein